MTDEQRRLQKLIEDKAAAAAGTVIIEAIAGSIKTARLHRDANIISGTTLITRGSSNGGAKGRRYSDAALETIASMAEGIPAYANHVAPDLAFKPRDVRDLIGRHRNVKFDRTSGRVTSDLHLVEHHAGWVFSLAERMGDMVGNSLVSKGLVRMESDGTEIVDDIIAVRSGDLVSDPAGTMKGLWESRDHDTRSIPETALATVQRILARQRGQVPVPEGLHTSLAEALVGRPSEPGVENADELRARFVAAVKR